MEIKTLFLENFRNFEKKSFKFSPQTTLIVGPNTSGKTNILEAVALLSRGDSFRAEKIEEMIRWPSQISNLKSQISNGEKKELEIILTRGKVQGKKAPKRKFSLNGVEKKKEDFVGHLLTVVFRPEDIETITGSPSLRRDFLNTLLEQTDWEYGRARRSYQKALKRRNKILEAIRERKAKKSDLFFWSRSLSRSGEMLGQAREKWINFVNQRWPAELRVVYQKNRFVAEKNLEKEIALGMTLTGPHRDDFWVEKNDRRLSLFGSRSEQRLAVLNLKLAELSFIREEVGEKPVLLLDDIFSELDEKFREKIFQIILGQQTIMTTADPRLIKKERRGKMKKIEL